MNILPTVLFTDSIDMIEGSLTEERRRGRPNRIWKKIRQNRSLNRKHFLRLSSGPEEFESELSLLATSYPTLTLDVSVGGLSRFEGKGSQERVLAVLFFLTQKGPEWNFIIMYLLEKFVGRFFNRNEENLGKKGLEVQQLLKVFGRVEIRQRYLSERYTEFEIKERTQRGAKLFEGLYFRFFDGRPLKIAQRKPGYDDKGKKREAHEYHGIPGKEGKEGQTMERRSVSDILTEIYAESTKNYLDWLQQHRKDELSRELKAKRNLPSSQERREQNESSTIEDSVTAKAGTRIETEGRSAEPEERGDSEQNSEDPTPSGTDQETNFSKSIHFK